MNQSVMIPFLAWARQGGVFANCSLRICTHVQAEVGERARF